MYLPGSEAYLGPYQTSMMKLCVSTERFLNKSLNEKSTSRTNFTFQQMLRVRIKELI